MSNLRNNKNLILIGSLIFLFILVVGFGIFYIFYSESSTATQAASYTSTSENSNNKSTSATSDFSETTETINPSSGENTLPNNTLDNSSNDFIFPNSSVEILKDYQLTELSKEKLALARNEIFARHGYIFQTEPFKSYFPKKSWYKPNPNFKGSYDELNEAERYNVDLIKKYENR